MLCKPTVPLGIVEFFDRYGRLNISSLIQQCSECCRFVTATQCFAECRSFFTIPYLCAINDGAGALFWMSCLLVSFSVTKSFSIQNTILITVSDALIRGVPKYRKYHVANE